MVRFNGTVFSFLAVESDLHGRILKFLISFALSSLTAMAAKLFDVADFAGASFRVALVFAEGGGSPLRRASLR